MSDLDLGLHPTLAYTLGAVLVAAISWFDDLWSLPNQVRFLAHTGGAVCLIFGLGYGPQLLLPCVGVVDLGWLALPLRGPILTSLSVSKGSWLVAVVAKARNRWLSGAPHIVPKSRKQA